MRRKDRMGSGEKAVSSSSSSSAINDELQHAYRGSGDTGNSKRRVSDREPSEPRKVTAWDHIRLLCCVQQECRKSRCLTKLHFLSPTSSSSENVDACLKTWKDATQWDGELMSIARRLVSCFTITRCAMNAMPFTPASESELVLSPLSADVLCMHVHILNRCHARDLYGRAIQRLRKMMCESCESVCIDTYILITD